jgi:hypothetical protein
MDWDKYAAAEGTAYKWADTGQILEGEVTAVEDRDDQFNPGKTIPVVGIRTADGEDWALYLAQYQLRTKMAQIRPNPGDSLRIEFTGEVDTGKGNPAKQFDVKVKRGDGTPTPTPAPEPAAAPAPAANDDGWS